MCNQNLLKSLLFLKLFCFSKKYEWILGNWNSSSLVCCVLSCSCHWWRARMWTWWVNWISQNHELNIVISDEPWTPDLTTVTLSIALRPSAENCKHNFPLHCLTVSDAGVVVVVPVADVEELILTRPQSWHKSRASLWIFPTIKTVKFSSHTIKIVISVPEVISVRTKLN